MNRLIVTLLLLPLPLLACEAKTPAPMRATHIGSDASELTHVDPNAQRLSAAGVELTLPGTWTIVDDKEPNFALAQGPGSEPPICTIELRRQPTSARAMPGLHDAESVEARDDYRRGRVRGRLQRLPGPSDDSTLLVHCASPRGAEWRAIVDAFDSLRTRADQPAQPSGEPNDGPIVELCTGTPAGQTYLCTRTRAGEVHCGISETDTLTKIPLPEPAQQIACEGIRACSRTAAGAVSCWRIDSPPELLTTFGSARDLAGGCIVDEQGKVSCRVRKPNGLTTEAFAELVPFDDPALALTDVEQVLAGSNAEQGCVVLGSASSTSASALRCWDRRETLGLALPDHTDVHELLELPDARELAVIDERVCVAGPEQWTCLEGRRRFVLDDCQRRSCGCSLTGAMDFSCEHEPLTHADSRPLGRVADVVLTDRACAVLRDGTVLCRGPVTGQSEDAPRIRELLVAGRPGILHTLQLR